MLRVILTAGTVCSCSWLLKGVSRSSFNSQPHVFVYALLDTLIITATMTEQHIKGKQLTKVLIYRLGSSTTTVGVFSLF